MSIKTPNYWPIYGARFYLEKGSFRNRSPLSQPTMIFFASRTTPKIFQLMFELRSSKHYQAIQFLPLALGLSEVFQLSDDGNPENAGTGWSGGFDVILGNPPWERIELKEKEFFALKDREIAKAKTSAIS